MKVFISYSSKDRAIVERMAANLNRLEHVVWFDQVLIGGQKWWEEILRNLLDCDAFIFALSPDSMESEACKLERSYAAALDKAIVPVQLSDVTRSALPLEIGTRQIVDYAKDETRGFIDLTLSLKDLPVNAPLPEPLPVPPRAPISPLIEIKARFEALKSLSLDEQNSLITDLRRFLLQPQYSGDARELLVALGERSDCYHICAVDIRNALDNHDRIASTEQVFTEQEILQRFMGVESISINRREDAYEELAERATKELKILGVGMTQISARSTDRLRKAAERIPIDFLMIDPDLLEEDLLLGEVAEKFFGHEFFPRSVKLSFERLKSLCETHNASSDFPKMRLRTYRTLPSVSMVMIDPDEGSSEMEVEFFPYRAEHRPRLLIKKYSALGDMHSALYKSFLLLWNSSREIV